MPPPESKRNGPSAGASGRSIPVGLAAAHGGTGFRLRPARRSQFLNFWIVSNIDHRLGTLRRMLVPSPHRPRHPSVTERPVALPPKHGESITCPNITRVPTHPCFLSNGLAAPSVRAA